MAADIESSTDFFRLRDLPRSAARPSTDGVGFETGVFGAVRPSRLSLRDAAAAGGIEEDEGLDQVLELLGSEDELEDPDFLERLEAGNVDPSPNDMDDYADLDQPSAARMLEMAALFGSSVTEVMTRRD